MKHDIGAEKKKLWLSVGYHWDSAMHGCYTTVWKAPCNLHPSNSLGDAGGDSNVTFINSWVMLNFFLVAWIWRSIDSLCDSEDFNGNETGSQILSQLVGLWRQAESLQTFSNPRKKQPGERNPTGGWYSGEEMQRQHDRRASKNRNHFIEHKNRSRISSERRVGKFILLCYKFWHVNKLVIS